MMNQNLTDIMHSKKTIEESIEENNMMIRGLKDKIDQLVSVSKRSVQLQTVDTVQSIESHVRLISVLKEAYSDFNFTLQKSIKEVRIERELEYNEDTIEDMYRECGKTADIIQEVNLSHKDDEKKEKVESGKESIFSWNILKKFRSKSNEKKGSSQSRLEETRSNSVQSVRLSSEEDIDKVWEKQVLGPLYQGKSLEELTPGINSLIKSGQSVSSRRRGLFWRKLLGNRGKITKRLFKLLLVQLNTPNQSVKESIIKDMDRTYSEFKTSAVFQHVRSESVKILQLFDVRSIDSDIQTRHRVHPEHVLHRGDSAAEHEHLPRLQGLLQSGLLERHSLRELHVRHVEGTVLSHQINNYYSMFNHLVMRYFPDKFEVMKANDIHPSIFMVEWFYTFFARQFNFEALFRLWDVVFFKGEVVLFRLVLLVFAKTDFSSGNAGDILNSMKRLDKILGTDFYTKLDKEVLTLDEFYRLQHDYTK